MKKYKYSHKQRVLEKIFIYALTPLACSLICSGPFWCPSLFSSIKAFIFGSLPETGSVLFGRKVLFIVGNLIIVVLFGESKFFASNSSPASDVYYDEYISRSRTLQNSSIREEIRERKMEKRLAENVKKIREDGKNMVKKRLAEEKVELEKERDDPIFPADRLSKRADDFIARVNRQRRLEATLLC